MEASYGNVQLIAYKLVTKKPLCNEHIISN